MADVVMEQVEKEISAIGEDVKKLKDSTEKALTDIRAYAEQHKTSTDVLVKNALDKHQTETMEKLAALQANLEQVEKKAGRLPVAGGGEVQDKLVDDAIQFKKTMLASKGKLGIDSEITVDNCDLDDYKAWNKHFAAWMRAKDERRIPQNALQVASDPDGGYTVKTAISDQVLKIIYETSPLREVATVETIGTSEIEIPIDDGEADCGWVGETDSPTETNTPQLGVQRIPVHEIYAMPKATQKLLEDSSVDIERWLATKIAEKFARTEATAFVSGNGVKKPRGFLSYAAGSTRGTIEQVNSGNANLVVFDGLINLITALKEPYHGGASFLMRRATEGSLLTLKDGQGQYLWRPGLEAGKPNVLLGYPVKQAADMPAASAGNLPVGFGNWKQGYTIVDRLGITVLRDPLTAKPFVLFYSRKRVGGDVTNYEAIKLLLVSA